MRCEIRCSRSSGIGVQLRRNTHFFLARHVKIANESAEYLFSLIAEGVLPSPIYFKQPSFRVQRLIRIGVIKGSEFKVDPIMVGFRTCAYIGLYLDNPGKYKDAIKRLSDIPEVIECHYTTGNYSLFIKVYTRDNEHLREVLTEKIQAIPGVMRTETLISLEESISRQIPVLSK